MDNKEKTSNYNKNYYNNVYKEIIKNKREFCVCCNKEFASWNIYKHNKTKKHKINSMSEDEKEKYLAEKNKTKILKQIDKLQNKLIT
jgi:hypothetical protein